MHIRALGVSTPPKGLEGKTNEQYEYECLRVCMGVRAYMCVGEYAHVYVRPAVQYMTSRAVRLTRLCN